MGEGSRFPGVLLTNQRRDGGRDEGAERIQKNQKKKKQFENKNEAQHRHRRRELHFIRGNKSFVR